MSDDYRLFVGSVNNFECILRDNTINNKMTLCFQKEHKDIIMKYRLIYAQNLDKWTKKVDVLLCNTFF